MPAWLRLVSFVLWSLLVWGFLYSDASAAPAPAQRTALAVTWELSRALHCGESLRWRGPRPSALDIELTQSARELIEDVRLLVCGADDLPATSSWDRRPRSQERCQQAIAAAAARYVGLNLVLREHGVPRKRVERLLRRIFAPVERRCHVRVRETRSGAVVPSVGRQCAPAIGSPGERVEAEALRRCLESLLAHWANRASSSPEPLRPNIVFIMTDDQRWDSIDSTHSKDGEPAMKAVSRELAAAGMNFREAYVTTPVCSPSRVAALTAQYAHNNGVFRNVGRGGGAPALDDTSTLATWLHDAGYRTGFFGKYLNQYTELWDPEIDPPMVPPGWDEWRTFDSDGGGKYYNYRMIENGDVVSYGSAERDYSTDVIARQALEFIDESVASGQPFFAFFNPSTPHWPYLPASRHLGLFHDLPPWAPPNFFEVDVSDKPAIIQRQLPLTYVGLLNVWATRRLQLDMLQAVDEFVGALMDKLREHGIEDDTAIVYFSDNGQAWGEHRWTSKACAYEECLRVPLVIRYPRLVPLPRDESGLVLGIDIAPTLVELAGATLPPGRDGRSLVRVLDGTDRESRKEFFFESYAGDWSYNGIHTGDWKFAGYLSGERELYDLVNDPYELENLAYRPEHFELVIRMYLRILDYRSDFPAVP